jgi:regulator of PEP synthase PpsR (kinase-PPPase family)
MKYSTCYICYKVKPNSEIIFSDKLQMCDKCNVSHRKKQMAIINKKSSVKLKRKKDAVWQPLVSKECREYCKQNKIFIKDLTNEFLHTLKIKYKIPQNTRFHTIRNAINNYR